MSDISQADIHLELLGKEVRDKVTGLEGIVTSVCFDLYGCVQTVIQPVSTNDSKIPDSRWFDVTRLKVLSHELVMDKPNFNQGYIAQGRKGCADKPVI